jgi:outer membrane protein assembly factor BamA
LEDEGYWYAELSIGRVEMDSSSQRIHIDLNVRLNGRVTIDWIRFEGAASLSDAYILRSIRFNPGHTATRAELNRIRSRLQALEDLSQVSEPTLISDSGRDGLLFTVSPAPSTRSDVLIGYADREVIGQASLSVRHLLKEGSRMDVRFHRLRAYQNRLDVNAGFGLVSGGFHLFQQDSTFFTRAVTLGADAALSDDLTLGVWFEQQSTTLGVIVPGLDLEEGTRRMSGLRAGWTSMTGSRASLRAGTGRLNGRPVTMSAADWSLIWRPERRFHAAVLGSAAALVSDRIPIDHLYRFGGATSFRGYREEEIQSSRYAWSELEGRFRLDTSSYAFAFAGGATTPDSPIRINSGIGFSIPTRLGPLRFTYAASSQRGWMNGVVHVSLSSAE